MADYSLGTAHGTIKIDADTGGADQASRALDNISQKGQSAGEAVRKTGDVMGVAGLAIAGGLALGVKTAADFEQVLSSVKAVSGATSGEMDKLHDKALQIGKDTAFGATEAASAMEELAKAGLSVDDILGGAADATVALAAAGGVDMPTAATIASNAMNQFGLAAGDMVHTTDLIAGAANASAIDVTDLGMSMSAVGAVANLAGLDFDETATAIAEMGNAGIKGSDAGTSLKAMLMNLQPTTKAATEQMKELGLMTEDGSNQFYDAQGNLKSLSDIQELLKGSMEGLTEAQKTQALETIFGSDAIRAAAVMADEGAAGYQKMNDAMLETSAADVAKTRQDNLKGSIEQMKGAAETLAITVGEQLTPKIRGLADGIGSVLDWFNSLSPSTQSLITNLLLGASAFLLVGAGIIKTVLTVQKFMVALRALGILSTATNAGLIKTMGTYIASVGRAIAAGATWVANAVAQIAVIIGQWIAMAAAATLNAAKSAAAWAVNGAKMIAQWVLMGAQAALQAARVAAAWLITNGAAMASALASMAIAVATTVAGWIVMGVTAMANAAIAAAAWFIALGPIGWAIAALIAVVAFIVIFWDDIKGYFKAGAEFVWGILQWAFEAYIGIWKAIWEGIKAAALGIWEAIKQMGAWIKDGWNASLDFLRGIPGWIMGIFSAAASWLLGAGRNVLSGLLSGLTGFWGTVWGWISGLGRTIISAFSGAGSWLLSAGGDLIRGLWNGVSGMMGWVMGKIKGFASSVVSGIKGFFGIGSPSKVMADEVGKWLPPGIAIGIDSSADEALKAAEALAANVAGSVSMSPGGSDAFWDGSSIGSGYVPPSPEVVSHAATQGDAATAAPVYNFNTYNPVAERASDSEARRLRALSSLGAFGG